MGGIGRRRMTMLGIGTIAITTLVLASCTPQIPPDDFYTPPPTSPTAPPPAEVPDSAPPTTSSAGAGELIRYEPSALAAGMLDTKPSKLADAFKVMYRSTNVLSESNVVTGTVLIPRKAWTGEGSRPLVTVGVGTRGVSDSCAPSWTMTQGWDYEAAEYDMMLRKGWAVAVTDMVGLGTPGLHTYEVGREQGTAMLDIVRAAHQIPEAALDPDGPVGIMGYSQGGTSAGWAAQLEATYAPELNIKGTAAAGIPGDLLAVAKALDGGPFMGLAMLAAVGYDAAYPELDLASYLNARGQRMLAKAESMCITQFDGIKEMFKSANSWFSGYMKDKSNNPLKDPKWIARLNENRLGGIAPAAPVLQQHARMDQMVAFPQAKNLRREWCDAGANVTWREHLLAEHVLGMLFSIDENLSFLSARFADKPVKGNC